MQANIVLFICTLACTFVVINSIGSTPPAALDVSQGNSVQSTVVNSTDVSNHTIKESTDEKTLPPISTATNQTQNDTTINTATSVPPATDKASDKGTIPKSPTDKPSNQDTTPKPPNEPTTQSSKSPKVTTSVQPTPNANNSTTNVPTAKPEPPLSTAVPHKERHFDGPSFIGGIVLTSGLMAIAFVAFKFYKARTERNYHTL